MTEKAHILTEEEFERMMNRVLDARQEMIGLPLNTVEARIEHRKDAEFVRSFRTSYESMAKSIGAWVIRAFIVGFLAVVGLGGKKLGAW